MCVHAIRFRVVLIIFSLIVYVYPAVLLNDLLLILFIDHSVTITTSQKQSIGAPKPFDARTDDWILYCQHFEHFLLANGITEDDPKKHLFLAIMGGATFKLLANLIAPKSPGEMRYEDIHKVLKEHYKPKPIRIAEQFWFY